MFRMLLLLLTSLLTHLDASKVIYIYPGQVGDMFAVNNPVFNRDDCLAPFCLFRDTAAQSGFEVRQTYSFDGLTDFDYFIVFEVPHDSLHLLKQYPKEKLILFLWEPPSVAPANYNPEFHEYFSKVYTWHDELVDNKKYFKLYYPNFHKMIPDPVAFDSKKLCTLIACNKGSSHPNELYSERLKVISFYEGLQSSDFDLYGRNWPTALKTYKGQIAKKVDILKQYKFCYAYENIKGIPGYVTEKIFDCFQAGCVPIYWGASNITDYVPKNCFIHREDFANDTALYAFIRAMDKETYEQYIINIRSFLESPTAKLFSPETFVSISMDLISTESKQ